MLNTVGNTASNALIHSPFQKYPFEKEALCTMLLFKRETIKNTFKQLITDFHARQLPALTPRQLDFPFRFMIFLLFEFHANQVTSL